MGTELHSSITAQPTISLVCERSPARKIPMKSPSHSRVLRIFQIQRSVISTSSSCNFRTRITSSSAGPGARKERTSKRRTHSCVEANKPTRLFALEVEHTFVRFYPNICNERSEWQVQELKGVVEPWVV